MTYAKLDNFTSDLRVKSVCIDIQNCNYDRSILYKSNIDTIPIKSKFDISWIKQLKLMVAEVHPDIIFCHGFNGPIIVQILRITTGISIPMVCTYHGKYHAPTAIKKPLAYIYNNLQALIYRHVAKKVFLVENFSMKYLLSKRIPREKMVVVHNGISDNKEETKSIKLSTDDLSIGLASRLDNVKGIEYLLEAVAILQKRNLPKFHVYILGDGPLEAKLKKMSTDLGVDKFVSFLGYQKNIGEWLSSWDIFVLPSLFEYHSIALLEAMRAGKAIVATSVGGNEESVRNSIEALIISSKSSSAIADALETLLVDEKLRKKLGENARNRFKLEFTEEVMMRNLAIELMKIDF